MTYYIRSQIVPLQIVKTTTNSGIGLSGTSSRNMVELIVEAKFTTAVDLFLSFLTPHLKTNYPKG